MPAEKEGRAFEEQGSHRYNVERILSWWKSFILLLLFYSFRFVGIRGLQRTVESTLYDMLVYDNKVLKFAEDNFAVKISRMNWGSEIDLIFSVNCNGKCDCSTALLYRW